MAMESAAEGRWTPAFAHAQAAVALAATDDELEMAMGAVSALVGHPDAPDIPEGLLRAVEAHLGSGEHGRPFAMRSLLTAHRMNDRSTDARSLAQELAAEYPRTDHALAGLAQEMELALAAGDISAAQTALVTMEADFPEEELTRAARAFFVLVAGEDALPARAAPVSAIAASTSASAEASVNGFVLHAAYPNPFNPQTNVRFELAVPAEVRHVVFDALCRRVAILTDGLVDAGVHTASFDGSRLASGMYLVRAIVQLETGSAMQTYTRRITLLK